MERETIKTLLLYFGVFIFGVIVGDLGNLAVAEFSTERYNFTIDYRVKTVSYIYAAGFVGFFIMIAIPMTLIASCTRHQIEYVRVPIQ